MEDETIMAIVNENVITELAKLLKDGQAQQLLSKLSALGLLKENVEHIDYADCELPFHY